MSKNKFRTAKFVPVLIESFFFLSDLDLDCKLKNRGGFFHSLDTSENHSKEGHSHVYAALDLPEICRSWIAIEIRSNLINSG